MPIELSNHFVAFIDLLGFSEMVREDCESVEGPKHVGILYEAHMHAASTLGGNLESGLIQFSDSIVFSRPFDVTELSSFISAVAQWQKSLLIKGLLCRGGITFGKHFVKDRFMFSKGLIDAYYIESKVAKVPRIVLSDNLLQLASTTIDIESLKTIKEEDGITFIDYLFYESPEERDEIMKAIEKLIAKKNAPSVMEKMRWLARYSDYKLNSNFAVPQFDLSSKN